MLHKCEVINNTPIGHQRCLQHKYRHKYIHFNHCQNLFMLFMYMHINLFYLVFILTNYCIIYSFIFVFLRPCTGIIRWTVQDGFVRCDLDYYCLSMQKQSMISSLLFRIMTVFFTSICSPLSNGFKDQISKEHIFFRLERMWDVLLDHRVEKQVDLPGVDCFCLVAPVLLQIEFNSAPDQRTDDFNEYLCIERQT